MAGRNRLNDDEGTPLLDEIRRIRDRVKRAMDEFLLLPTVIIVAMVGLGILTAIVDRIEGGVVGDIRAAIQTTLLVGPNSTLALLQTVAGAVITVTSITFSLLLIALQQAASGLTVQVLDQYVRRRMNQAMAGYFVGLSLYILIVLAAINTERTPVFSLLLTIVLTGAALYLLIIVLFTTILQMRSASIVTAIKDLTLGARERQLKLIRRLRSEPGKEPVRRSVHTVRSGHFVSLDLKPLQGALRDTKAVEVRLSHNIGSFLPSGAVLAEIAADDEVEFEALEEAIRRAVIVDTVRNLSVDPEYGVSQLASIGWTAISTAKQSSSPGSAVINAFRDVVAHWWYLPQGEPDENLGAPLPVVYQDRVPAQLLREFESLAVVSGESMQHHSFAAVIRALSEMIPRLPPAGLDIAEDVVLRSLSVLDRHRPTHVVDEALDELRQRLARAGRVDSAEHVARARAGLAAIVRQGPAEEHGT